MIFAESSDLPAVNIRVSVPPDPSESLRQSSQKFANPIARLRMIEDVEQHVDLPRISGCARLRAGTLVKEGNGMQEIAGQAPVGVINDGGPMRRPP